MNTRRVSLDEIPGLVPKDRPFVETSHGGPAKENEFVAWGRSKFRELKAEEQVQTPTSAEDLPSEPNPEAQPEPVEDVVPEVAVQAEAPPPPPPPPPVEEDPPQVHRKFLKRSKRRVKKGAPPVMHKA